MSQSISEYEEKLLANIPHVTGFLSIIGSICIIGHIMKSKVPKIQVHQHILIGLCLSDFVGSIGFSMSTWLIPTSDEDPMPGAVGNEDTCKFQGFLVQLSIMSAIFNFFLALHYLCLVKYKVTERKMRQKVLPGMYAFAFIFGFGTAISALSLDLYHNAYLWCWIARSDTGNNHWEIYRWVYYYGPLWICLVGVSIIMGLLYAYVKEQERETARYLSRASAVKRKLESMKLANQSMFYVACFYITWVPATINRVYEEVGVPSPFPIVLMHAIFAPGQGFLNFLVYVRPKYIRYREEKRKRKEREKCRVNRISVEASENDSRHKSESEIKSSENKFYGPTESDIKV